MKTTQKIETLKYESPVLVHDREAKKHEWIRCSDFMPPIGKMVRVWREGMPEATAAYLRSDGEFGLGYTIWKYMTYWAPMSAPFEP